MPTTGLRILIAEDEVLIGILLTEMLEGMGHEVCANVRTESEIVGAAFQCEPDLMIVDARLAEGSGVSAVEEILRTRFVRHVFASGDTTDITTRWPSAVVIRKPFSRGDLLSAIERALQQEKPQA